MVSVAENIVKTLEERGIKYVFGIPGEENIRLVDAIHNSDKIRFILVRHEQGASFMAEVYGRLTGLPGVATATLGPGAINLLLGVADAFTTSTPMIAITAQGGLNRIYKESHQVIDLEAMFRPITKWAGTLYTAKASGEVLMKAYNNAVSGRPGPTYLAIPQDVEEEEVDTVTAPLPIPKEKSFPDQSLIAKATDIIAHAKHPILLAGTGVVREHAVSELRTLVKETHIPVATTFMGKGAVSDEDPYALGVVGFMVKDYENFAFDEADVLISVGYSFSEFDPKKINPNSDKTIIHLNSFGPETDSHFPITVNIISTLNESIKAIRKSLVARHFESPFYAENIRKTLAKERAIGASDTAYPFKPQTLVYVTRVVMPDKGIVLVDTGALKMWMARLYPTYEPNTCLIDNGLSTMSWTLPGAIGAKLAVPDQPVLAVMGDGSFMMNSQEIETAVREKIPMTILIWTDKAYGLIKWKMDLELGHHSEVDFSNPDFVKYAKSFGAVGHLATSREDLKESLEKALSDEEHVNVIIAPVDYEENNKLLQKLGDLTISI
ncbi:acetolactate synthase large subunit [Bavariicoccus seileri]|uniref:acetolactate synthase large subunit n=1 Tax=Bavariicoccus seileri TaxID=549685 RepID=UPI0003B5B318|nr:acetolactate synthase large subunit [Bavariicoccus seileri]